MSAAILKRLRAMDGAELRFRATAALRTRVDRARTVLGPPVWRRESLRLAGSGAPAAAQTALARGDWMGAHVALAAHFTSRPAAFPLDPRELPALAARVSQRFPGHDAGERAERILAGEYDLLGYRGVRAGSPPDWHMDAVHQRRAPLAFWNAVPYLDPACGDHKVTWEINRHQHFLVLGRAHAITGDARYYDAFVAHLTDWIRANPPLTGTNWASMLELAFRSLSWLWALHFFAPAASDRDAEPWIVDLLVALDRQLTHVEQNLSRYFSPNTHLSGEALALYVAGRALPELAGSAARERVGRDVLLTEATRQVRPDGTHAELSAHYHRYSTDFYLLAFNEARITHDSAEPAFREAAHRQAHFLRALADDSGYLPLIGDDDGGQLFPICGRRPMDAADSLATASVLVEDPALAVGAIPEETYWACGMAADVPQRDTHARVVSSAGFPDAGYYISRDAAGSHLVFDCGPHGFLNGGHAHADALAIVARVKGRPFLVDPGTATYTMNPAVRNRFRSTAMHNTVVLDGRDQSLPRGPFHWMSRADARCVVWAPGARADYVEGQHDGYAPAVHTRCVFAIHEVGWIVIDHIHGSGASAGATSMWHVHPAWTPEQVDRAHVRMAHADGTRVSLLASAPIHRVSDPLLEEYAPEYGRIERGSCYAVSQTASAPFSVATFIAAASEWDGVAVAALTITQPAGVGWHAAAFRIDTARGTFIATSAVELAGKPMGASPAQPWGPDARRTTARSTLVLLTPEGAQSLCSVADAQLASSMHQVGSR